jgi:predicted GNAT family acetyltransferase
MHKPKTSLIKLIALFTCLLIVLAGRTPIAFKGRTQAESLDGQVVPPELASNLNGLASGADVSHVELLLRLPHLDRGLDIGHTMVKVNGTYHGLAPELVEDGLQIFDQTEFEAHYPGATFYTYKLRATAEQQQEIIDFFRSEGLRWTLLSNNCATAPLRVLTQAGMLPKIWAFTPLDLKMALDRYYLQERAAQMSEYRILDTGEFKIPENVDTDG